MLHGGGTSDGGTATGPLYGPMAAMAPTMLHHTMRFDTLGYRRSFPYPQMAEPVTGLGGGTFHSYLGGGSLQSMLGCCDWCTDDRLGDTLADCPQGPTVIVSSDMPDWFNYKLNIGADQPIDIPGWLFWIAGAVALFHLLK